MNDLFYLFILHFVLFSHKTALTSLLEILGVAFAVKGQKLWQWRSHFSFFVAYNELKNCKMLQNLDSKLLRWIWIKFLSRKIFFKRSLYTNFTKKGQINIKDEEWNFNQKLPLAKDHEAEISARFYFQLLLHFL